METVDSRKRNFDEMEEQQATDEAEQLSYTLSVIYLQSYPWLFISQGEDLQNQTFVDVCHPVVDSQYFSNIPESQCFTCSIPEMHKKFICATRNQWLVLKNESMFVSLLNLITREVVSLLMMEHCHISDICLLSSRPTDSNDDCHVFFIHRATFEFFYCKLGDREFKKQLFESEQVTQIATATVFGRNIYFLTKLDAALEMLGHPPRYVLFSAQIVGTDLSTYANIFVRSYPL